MREKRIAGTKGLTLSELLLSTLVLVLALAGLLGFFLNCLLINEANREQTICLAHAGYIMEEIRGSEFSGLEDRINNNNGTAQGWDFNASSLEASPYNLSALRNETISTAVFQSGGDEEDLLGVSVSVSWQDRRLRIRNIQLKSLFTNLQ